MSPENDTKDVWETSTGMVEDCEAWIAEPYFGVDEHYNASAMLFCARLVGADGEEITTLKYSVGEDWETNNEGTEITHPAKSQINKNSRYGRFIDRLVKPTSERAPADKRVTSSHGKDNGLGLGNELRQNGGSPLKASTFEGLGFRWQLSKMETLGKDDGGNVIYKEVLLPTEWKGRWKGGVAKAVPATAPTATASAPVAATAPAAAAATASNGELTIPLRKRLTLLALENDVKTFMQKAGRDREVLGLPDAVMGHILDGGAEGFHAQANQG